MLFSWAIGITAARNVNAEKVILPALDILQSIPILGFFPVVLVVFVVLFPPDIGVYLAVVFLIFTSMTWNIAFAVYEAVKAIPLDFMRLATIEKMGLWQKLRVLYIPATWSKVAYNSIISWSVALFYLVASEIFSLGNSKYSVKYGIGADIAKFGSAQMWDQYISAIFVLVVALVLTYFLFLNEFSKWSEKYKIGYTSPSKARTSPIYRFYHWVNMTVRASVQPYFTFLPVYTQRAWRGLSLVMGLGNSVQMLRSETVLGEQQQEYRELQQQKKQTRTIAIEVLILCMIAATVFILLYASNPAAFPADFGAVAADEAKVIPAFVSSLIRVWYVYFVAAAISVPLGVFIALNERVYSILVPVLQIAAAIPAPALLPPIAFAVATIPYSGEINAFFIILLGMIWYLVFNIVEGIRSIPKQIFDLASLLEMKRWNFWRNALFPALLPSFVTGSITAVGGGWNTLIIAEYFSVTLSNGQPVIVTQVSSGIGKLLDLAAATGDMLLLALCVITMVAFVFAFNVSVWRRLYRLTTRHSLLEGSR